MRNYFPIDNYFIYYSGAIIVYIIEHYIYYNNYSHMRATAKNVVFIVDDDPDDRQLILDAFLETNPTIDCAFIEDGDQLMATLDTTEPENLPSLILLDLNMPGMMGLQALKNIRSNRNYSHIPTIILTTSTLSQDES